MASRFLSRHVLWPRSPSKTTLSACFLTRDYSRNTKPVSKFLRISDEVQTALQDGTPVVALETTIYTHGFPFPENVALSEQLESIVRDHGAVPATIGVLNGVARVGMSSQEAAEMFEKASNGWPTVKLSRRDIGWICGQGILGKDVNGGTTIAGTMVLAHLAGIKVFATGGLGGVHRGGETSMDVSADLTELGRTPVALISSGCKSFLDIPRTLEYLETQGVGVGTFADGRENEVDFPAFWTRDSGTPSPRTIQDEKEAAAIIHAQFNLPMSSGLFFANPIAEEHSLSKEYMDEIMARAVSDAEDAGVAGHRNTPFVLSRIRDLTKGSTITANRALVAGNVARGAKVALELAKLERKATAINPVFDQKADAAQHSHGAAPGRLGVLVAGSLALDLSGDYVGVRSSPGLETSNPAKFSESAGGVGRNIAQAISYMGASTRLCSAVGDDSAGTFLLESVRKSGLVTDAIRLIQGQTSARYVAFNDQNKELVMAMADMSILETGESNFEEIWQPMFEQYNPKWLALDANWSSVVLDRWIDIARRHSAKVAFEPVSEEKASRLFMPRKSIARDINDVRTLVDLATPNARELRAMKTACLALLDDPRTSVELFESLDISAIKSISDRMNSPVSRDIAFDVLTDALYVLPYIPTLLITLGKMGVLLVRQAGEIEGSEDGENSYRIDLGDMRVEIQHHPIPVPIDPAEVSSVNGVGDTFFGVVLAGLASGRSLGADLISIAQKAAGLTLQSNQSVSPQIKALTNDLRSLGH